MYFESLSFFPQLQVLLYSEYFAGSVSLPCITRGTFFFSQQNPKDLVEVVVALVEVAAAGVLVVAAVVAASVVVDHLALEAFSKRECQSSDLLRVEMLVRKTLRFQHKQVNGRLLIKTFMLQQ